MRNLTLILGLILCASPLFGMYYDWNVKNESTYYLASSGSNDQTSVVLNRASVSAKVNIDDNAYLSASLKDDLIYATNADNRVYLDSLFINWKGQFFSLSGGRQSFSTGSFYIIGMPGDGVNADLILFENHFQLIAYSTALLPPILDTMDLNLEDRTNGSKRLIGGVRWVRNGLIGDETALGFYMLYDLKNTNSLYQPWYVELNQNGAVLSSLGYKLNLFYEGGQNGSLPVSAYAGELEFLYKILKNPGLGLSANVAFASGDSDRSGLYPEDITNGTDDQFIAPGSYANGVVLYPDLSNILAFRLSIFLNLKNGFGTVLNLANYNKMNPQAPMSDSTASQNALMIGTELSFVSSWHLDYSLDLNLSGGVLFKADAYVDRTPQYKLMAGCVFRL